MIINLFEPKYILLVLGDNLGNQLFSFAAAKYVSELNNDVKIYISSRSDNVHPVLRLLADQNDIACIGYDMLCGHINNSIKKSLGPFSILYTAINKLHYFQKRKVSDFNSYITWIKNGSPFPVAIKGYFQERPFFINSSNYVCEKILNVLQPWLDKVPNADCVLNVRRGDFVLLGRALPIDYYLNSIEALKISSDTVVTIC